MLFASRATPTAITAHSPEHRLVLLWLLWFGLMVFGLVVAYDRGWLYALVVTDKSKITLLIAAIYVFAVAHSLKCTLYLSRELRLSEAIAQRLREFPNGALTLDGRRLTGSDGNAMPSGFVTDFIADLVQARTRPAAQGHPVEDSDLLAVYTASIRKRHELGWFICDVFPKLGLVGTLVGFVFMLGSLGGYSDVDSGMMQQVLKEMSFGMGTALYVTLTGIGGAILLSIEYHWLDDGLEELIERTVYLTEVEVLPRLRTA